MVSFLKSGDKTPTYKFHESCLFCFVFVRKSPFRAIPWINVHLRHISSVFLSNVYDCCCATRIAPVYKEPPQCLGSFVDPRLLGGFSNAIQDLGDLVLAVKVWHLARLQNIVDILQKAFFFDLQGGGG